MNNLNNGTVPFDTVLEQSIQDIDIPPRPAVLARIQSEMLQEEPDVKLLGRLITADVSLAAGLIKTANSPYFGLVRRVSSVNEALLTLGLDATCRAVAAICLRKAFPQSASFERFWDASAKIAALSGWLATRIRIPGLYADATYTFGLFRDCGIVILLRRYTHYQQTLDAANHEDQTCFTAVERGDWPTDHATIGSLLALNWWLPESICQGIRHHHDTMFLRAPSEGHALASRQLAAVSQVAEHFLQLCTGASSTQEWTKLGADCMHLLGLNAQDISALQEEAQAQLQLLD